MRNECLELIDATSASRHSYMFFSLRSYEYSKNNKQSIAQEKIMSDNNNEHDLPLTS